MRERTLYEERAITRDRLYAFATPWKRWTLVETLDKKREKEAPSQENLETAPPREVHNPRVVGSSPTGPTIPKSMTGFDLSGRTTARGA
jgi:hypothetical protein